MQTKKNNKTNIWSLLMLGGAVVVTALEGTGMSVEELSSWSVLFVLVSNLFGNPYKITTIILVILAFFIPRDSKNDEEVKKAQERRMIN